MASAFEKALSLEWNGKVFVLTLRNEITTNSTLSGNTLLYSYDGKSWFPDSNITNESNPYNIKWTGHKYLMETDHNIKQSRDGLNWSTINSYIGGINEPLPNIYDIEVNLEQNNTIQFPQNITLALGGISTDSTKIAYSTDSGITWIPSASTSSVFNISCNNAKWNGKIWVAVGSGGNTIATSKDGIAWTGRGAYIFTTEANAVEWSNELCMWVAVGSGTNSIAYSYDGIYWFSSLSTSSNGLTAGLDIKWNSRTWIACGTSSHIGLFTSNDGINWTQITDSDISYNNFKKIIWNDSYWAGIINDNTNRVITSIDGMNWSNKIIENNISNGYYSSRTNQTILLSGNTIYNNINNTDSYDTTNITTTSPSAVIYNGTYYIIGGDSIAISPDIKSWSYNNISNMSQINNFAWNNPDHGSPSIAPISVALGSGANTIAYSLDGIYWIGTGSSVFTSKGNKAAWNGSIWCAVGKGGYWVATSYDGIVWTGRDNYWMEEGYDIAWNGHVFIAVGYGNVTMASSADGIHWEGIVETPLDKYASSIIWSGKIWVVYGSGTTTSTAYSSQVLGNIWESSNTLAIQNAQSVFTPSYFTSSTLTGYVASASSQQTDNESYRAFDNSFSSITSWHSDINTYSSGNYIGSQTTTYNNGSISGEWLQIQLPSPESVIYYYIILSLENTALPKEWKLLGSQTGESDWVLLDSFSFGSTPPNNTNGYPFLVIPRNITRINTSYSYYRIVIPSIFGENTFAEIAGFDLYASTATSNQLDPHIRPIVTNTHILHPTNLLNIQGVGNQPFYIPTDLYGNKINNYYLNHIGYANSAIYGIGDSSVVAQTFDGDNYLVLANSGAATRLSCLAANTTMNFSPTFNNSIINTNLTQAYAATYNKRSILLGGINGNIGSITYATLGTGSIPIFRQTNAFNLFTSVYGLASNSGYGPVYIPNTLYLKPEDKISIISPKTYPDSLSNTSITMNMSNAQII